MQLMRSIALTFFALAALAASAAEPAQSYPLWDGQESIEQYARRAGLEPTNVLDLGDGVKLDLVLIPAGRFTMGALDPPPPVDKEGYRSKILTGKVVLAVGGGVSALLMGLVLIRAIRKRQRPQYSLAWFLTMTATAGIGLLGGLHWYFSTQTFARAQSEYQAALAASRRPGEEEEFKHDVTLTKPYYLGKFEVTQEQYHQVMGSTPNHFKGSDLPVAEVHWWEAQAFCKKASEKTGWLVRLPTETEWERACRAGTRTTYYTGDAETDLDPAGWYYKNSGGSTHPVGKKAPNAWGLHDMHGNVWEWCMEVRVVRGGGWCVPGRCRSADRMTIPEAPCPTVGFRVVVEWLSRTP